MQVSEVLQTVTFILNDRDMVTHTQTDLLYAVNMAIRVICDIRSDASSAIGEVVLEDGILQSLPDGGLRLLDSCYRMNDDDTFSPLQLISRKDMDRLDPTWPSAPAGKVREIAYDERHPGRFWTIPPAVAGDRLELMYSTVPDQVTEPEDRLPVSDKYAPMVVEYVLYLMFSRDSENSRNQNRASGHLQTCLQLLGMKSKADLQVSPNQPES